MRDFFTPTIVISRCVEIVPCRHDGLKIASDFIKKLIPYVNLIPVCSEVEIGLAAPREVLHIDTREEEMKLIQTKTGLDFTEKINDFANSFLESLHEVDGFILKERLPTSALKDAKKYILAQILVMQ